MGSNCQNRLRAAGIPSCSHPTPLANKLPALLRAYKYMGREDSRPQLVLSGVKGGLPMIVK